MNFDSFLAKNAVPLANVTVLSHCDLFRVN